MSAQKLTVLSRTLIVGLVAAIVGIVSISHASDVDRRSVTIWSEGVRLAGDVYTPKSIEEGQRLPGVLMIAGWGGNKSNVGRNYAEAIAAEGFVVLTFDFKGWGESDGPLVASTVMGAADESQTFMLEAQHVRGIIDPYSMSADVRAALYFLGGEPQVMPNNLGVWGTSMGGGLGLIPAATDPRVKAFVSQMGPVNYAHNLQALPADGMWQIETLTARGELPAFPGPVSRIDPSLAGFPDWPALKRFNLMPYVNHLATPTLVIDAEDETMFDRQLNGVLLFEAVEKKADARYVTFPGGHYDMYHGENLGSSRQAALEWFQLHLKGE
ncbi:alpha/beta fold hydrolase [uncultured Umboniibacter sp.]|uniref:alpha/beta hydrolase n=1 Tax=uncultured Umboniibacter sp. TaxID=1798917 RepID=UPI002620AF9D|nr:alpha/beta fold hydrolase [uncultured Umboniibacter sp.]